jgi:putative cell wall-binding protein
VATPGSLTFTTANWNVPQTVTLSAPDNGVAESTRTLSVPSTVASSDPHFSGACAPAVATTLDDGALTSRITGVTPLELALAVSQASFTPGSGGAVLIGRDDLLIDEFAATSLASVVNGSMLLTPSDHLDGRVAAEIARVLGNTSKRVYVLGGTDAVSTAVTDALQAAGYSSTRLGGRDRRFTAAEIAREVVRVNPAATSTAYIVEDLSLVDAFGVGPAAGDRVVSPQVDYVLLQDRGSSVLTEATATFLDEHPELRNLVLVGGTDALHASLEANLTSRYPQLTQVQRYRGADRFATNAALNTALFPTPSMVYVANGQADRIPGALQATSNGGTGLFGALLAGAAAARDNAPLVLTKTDELPVPQLQYLKDRAASILHAVLVGSIADLSAQLQSSVAGAI